MEESWREFDALELIPKQNMPRVLTRRLFQINPLGQIRYLQALPPRDPKYVEVKPVKVNGKSYFVATVGFVRGCQVVVRKEISELVQKYFPS